VSALEQIQRLLLKGEEVAFITEGDPMLHSTFLYLLEYLPQIQQVEIVSGISSIMASAASAVFPLCSSEECFAVLPASRSNRSKIKRAMEMYDVIVLMKVHSVLDDMIDLLEEMNLTDKAVLIELASHVEQKVYRDVKSLRGKRVHYFSTLLVRCDSRVDEEGV